MLIEFKNNAPLEAQKHFITMLPVSNIFKFIKTKQSFKYLDFNINGLRTLSM